MTALLNPFMCTPTNKSDSDFHFMYPYCIKSNTRKCTRATKNTVVASIIYLFCRFRSAVKSLPPGGHSQTQTWCGPRALTIWLVQGRCCYSVSPIGQPTPSSHRGSQHSHTCGWHENVKYCLKCATTFQDTPPNTGWHSGLVVSTVASL